MGKNKPMSTGAKVAIAISTLAATAIVGLIIVFAITGNWPTFDSTETETETESSVHPCLADPECAAGWALKPIIYLYPQQTTDISVTLDYSGYIFASYPNISSTGSWSVTASPDSTLINHADGKEYSYLFWEGTPDSERIYDWSQGFVVAGSDTREFLQDKLSAIGLTPREYNEFIVYWYPKMMQNAYNLVHFATYDEYDKYAPLDISPRPDAMLRVFMVFKPISQPTEITPQSFTPFKRTGFTVVEWGGSELN